MFCEYFSSPGLEGLDHLVAARRCASETEVVPSSASASGLPPVRGKVAVFLGVGVVRRETPRCLGDCPVPAIRRGWPPSHSSLWKLPDVRARGETGLYRRYRRIRWGRRIRFIGPRNDAGAGTPRPFLSIGFIRRRNPHRRGPRKGGFRDLRPAAPSHGRRPGGRSASGAPAVDL